MRIRLTRKLASCVNGVDISNLRVGDIVDLPEPNARMLIAEDWAEPAFGDVRAVGRTREARDEAPAA